MSASGPWTLDSSMKMKDEKNINLKLRYALDAFLDFLLDKIEEEHDVKQKAEIINRTVKEAFK